MKQKLSIESRRDDKQLLPRNQVALVLPLASVWKSGSE